MKKMLGKTLRSALSMILAFSLVFGMCGTALATELTDKNGDDVINYVSLGASNVNGFGMRGYVPIAAYDNPLMKAEVNIFGYKSNTPGSYPVLIKEALEAQGKDVELTQLAISSMRAEEVLFLLDDSYTGDAYTDWRFIDVPGYDKRNSQNWYWGAGMLELGQQATPEASVAALKAAYRKAVKEADFLTIDVGVNNFGVYACNQIVSNMYENDLNTIDPELAAAYAEGKEYVMGLLRTYMGSDFDKLPQDTINHMVDSLTYALVGFCMSFDKIMEYVYTVNPDVTVAVVSIQNLMYGLNAILPGTDLEVPFGDLFGALVNAANLYTATLSPYCDKYVYADVREDGHVEFFSDEILRYNGDPSTLSQDVKDCFDVYDNDLYIRFAIQQYCLKELAANPETSAYVTISDEQKNDMVAFITGTHDQSIQVAGMALLDFLAAGEAGQLPEQLQAIYGLYHTALYTTYDVLAEIMKAGAELECLDLDCYLGDAKRIREKDLRNVFIETIMMAVGKALADPTYSFKLEEAYPQGIYKAIAEKYGVEESAVNTVAAMYVRTSIGNSFFGHPNGNGHVELKNAVLSAVAEDTTGKDILGAKLQELLGNVLNYLDSGKAEIDLKNMYQIAVEKGYMEAVLAELQDEIDAVKQAYVDATTYTYAPNKDSVYVAIGDASAYGESYVELVAEELNVEVENLAEDKGSVETAFATVAKNAATIAKADLISVGFTSNTFINDAINQAAGMGKSLAWAELLGEEAAGYVAEAVVQVKAALAKEVGADNAELFGAAVEAYAYSCAAYALKMPELVNEIRAINPDAAIVIVGMYNPLEDVELEMDGIVVQIGEYMDYLTAAAGVHALGYAMLTSNGVFVEASEVETVYEADAEAADLSMEALIMEYIRNWGENFLPSEAGHQYIAEQIIGAIRKDAVLGDANGDGAVNAKDAMLVLQYYTKKITADKLDASVCDVDGNGTVNAKDAMLILQKYTKKITSFPVEAK